MLHSCLATAVLLVSTSTLARSQSANYQVVALPDTQYYTTTPALFGIMLEQIDWIRTHAVTDGITFVTHVGDVVHSGATGQNQNQVEWERGLEALNQLEGGLPESTRAPIPYSVAIGNRDYDVISDKGQGTARFEQFFSGSRYHDEPWFLGSSRNNLLHAQRFQTPAGDWLHIALDWKPSDASLLYAQEVIDSNPGTPVMITTHEQLGSGVNAAWRTEGGTPNGSGNNDPEQTYRKLLEPNPAISILFCGHISGGGYRTDTTIFGRDVHQVLSDFQEDAQGGNGWLMTAEFDEAQSKIRFETKSPTYVPGVTLGPDRSIDPRSNFERDYDSAAHRRELSETRTLHFRNGLGLGRELVWNGTTDTFVGSGAAGVTLPDDVQDGLGDLVVDGNEDRETGLLAFNGLVGTGRWQVPPGATVRRAILTLTTEGGGATSLTGARLHRMLVPWSGSDTWTSLGNGIQVGSECEGVADVTVGAEIERKGTRSFDVTGAVQGWAAGVPNYGWAIFGDGHDQWTFRSSEWHGAMERPQLTVQFEVSCQLPAPYCVTEANSTGERGRLRFTGSQLKAALDLRVTAVNLPPIATTLFMAGLSRAARTVGDGRICVGGPALMRLGGPVMTDGAGVALESVDPALAASMVAISERWNFQAWHRDSSAAGSNLTDAIDVVFCD